MYIHPYICMCVYVRFHFFPDCLPLSDCSSYF